MRRFAGISLAITLLAAVLAAGIAAGWKLWKDAPARPAASSAAGSPQPKIVLPPPVRPVPASLEGAFRSIEELQHQGNFSEACKLYPGFIKTLAAGWGESSADLAPYFFNCALAFKLGGDLPRSLAIAASGLEKWPGHLQLRVFAATTRAESAIQQGTIDAQSSRDYEQILQENNFPLLRGMRVDIPQLYGQWSRMLLLGNQHPRALELIDKGLAMAPADWRLKESKAQALIRLSRLGEALPLLQELAAHERKPEFEFYLAKGLLENGQAARALEEFTRLKQSASGGERWLLQQVPGQRDTYLQLIESLEARALIEMQRFEESRDLLLRRLLAGPENTEFLFLLEKTERGLKNSAAADALVRRGRQLLQRDKILQVSGSARAAGFLSSVTYYRALVHLETDRTGEAFKALQEALSQAPRIAQSHLEVARVHGLLGRWDLAASDLDAGHRACGSPALLGEKARCLVLLDRKEAARDLLASLQTAALDPKAPEIFQVQERTVLLSRRARAWLELGNAPEAAKLLESELDEDLNAEESLLCRAELAFLEGKAPSAGSFLAGSFQNTPGGAHWKSALDLLQELHGIGSGASAPIEGRDPSDLLDHPRLFLNEAYLRSPSGEPRPAAAEFLRRVAELHRARLEILSRAAGLPDGDAAPRYRELCALYFRSGAVRKAREAAWFLAFLKPEGIEEHRLLLKALASPEEVLTRLTVLEKALKLEPQDAELQSLRAAGLAFLGKN